MKVFKVKFSFNGKTYKGEVEAKSKKDAERKLREKLVVISVEEKYKKGSAYDSMSSENKKNFDDIFGSFNSIFKPKKKDYESKIH